MNVCVFPWSSVSFNIFSSWLWVNTYRYIFSGMNIHLPAILGFTRYQGFDPSPVTGMHWDAPQAPHHRLPSHPLASAPPHRWSERSDGPPCLSSSPPCLSCPAANSLRCVNYGWDHPPFSGKLIDGLDFRRSYWVECDSSSWWTILKKNIIILIRNFRDESLSISWSKHDRWGMVILCRKSDCLLLYSIGWASTPIGLNYPSFESHHIDQNCYRNDHVLPSLVNVYIATVWKTTANG